MDILLCFFVFFPPLSSGRTTLALHDFNKLALASIPAGCHGRRSFMRMSPDPCELNRRLRLWASSGTHFRNNNNKTLSFFEVQQSCLCFWRYKLR